MVSYNSRMTKDEALQATKDYIREAGWNLTALNEEKPWGAYYSINPDQAEEFVQTYFPKYTNSQHEGLLIQPKFLLLAPGGEQLSWQYHDRRSEVWHVVFGEIDLITSDNDTKTQPSDFITGNTIELTVGTRHTLVGRENWTLVAEIWQHTDANNPSTEEDITRISDSYGREGSNVNEGATSV